MHLQLLIAVIHVLEQQNSRFSSMSGANSQVPHGRAHNCVRCLYLRGTPSGSTKPEVRYRSGPLVYCSPYPLPPSSRSSLPLTIAYILIQNPNWRGAWAGDQPRLFERGTGCLYFWIAAAAPEFGIPLDQQKRNSLTQYAISLPQNGALGRNQGFAIPSCVSPCPLLQHQG